MDNKTKQKKWITNAFLEKQGPVTIGVIAVLCYYRIFEWWWIIPSSFKDLLSASISIAAIAIGFLMTVKSILIAVEEKRPLVNFRQSGGLTMFLNYTSSAIRWSFYVAIFSAFGLLLKYSDTSCHPHVFAIWLFFIVTATFKYLTVSHVFSKLLKQTYTS